MKHVVLVLLLVGLAFGVQITANEPTDYTIGTTGFGCSLRGAIINANANAVVDPNCPAGQADSADVILLTVDFRLTITGRNEDAGYTGDLDINDSIFITGNRPGRRVDGGGIDRVFDVRATYANFGNLTITGGDDNGFPTANVLAGGIRSLNVQTFIGLFQVTFLNNIVDLTTKLSLVNAGAGILTFGIIGGENVVFDGNRIRGTIPNQSSVAAAAAVFDDTSRNVTLREFAIVNNVIEQVSISASTVIASAGVALFQQCGFVGSGYAQNNRARNGGMIYAGPSTTRVEIDATDDFFGNTAVIGGVVAHIGDTLDINMHGYSVYENTASGYGGAFVVSGAANIWNFTNIENNSAPQGGAIVVLRGVLNLFTGVTIQDNSATQYGGAILLQQGNIFVQDIEMIINNEAVKGGGFVSLTGQFTNEIPGITIRNISELSYNSATEFESTGGVVFSKNGDVLVELVGSITQNFAYQGAVVYANHSTAGTYETVIQLCDNIYNNSALHSDGAATLIWSSLGDALLQNITNSLSDNNSPNGDGGLIWVYGGSGTISDMDIEITRNFGFNGGLMSVNGPGSIGTIERISGDIWNNTGFFDGGLLHCSDGAVCFIQDITGDIYGTDCGSGCLIYSENNATLRRIDGDIYGNVAFFDGGVVTGNDVYVTELSGTIRDNVATTGDGGAFYSEVIGGSINVQRVFSITNNRARMNGGVASCPGGYIILADICFLENNTAVNGFGGVAYAFQRIALVSGHHDGNDPDLGYSFGEGYGVNIYNFDPVSAVIDIIGVTPEGYIGEVTAADGPLGEYKYLWDNGDTSEISANIRTGTPRVLVTDRAYCKFIATYEIPPPVANAGPDNFTCPGAPYVLGGNPSGTAGTDDVQGSVTYDWGPTNILVAPLRNISNPVIRIVETTVFTLTVTDVLTNVSTVDTVTITIPTITVNAGPDKDTCRGTPVTIGGDPTASCNYPLTLIYSWSPNQALSSVSDPNPQANPVGSQDYEVIVSTVECPNLVVTDEMSLNIMDLSNPYAQASPGAGTQFTICNGSSIILGGNTFGSPEPLSFVWTPADSLDDPTSAHPIASPVETTTYTMQVTTANGCGTSTDRVTVVVNDLSAHAGNDLLTSGVIGGSPTAQGGRAPFTYSWSPASGLSSTLVANPIAAPVQSTTYRVTVRDANGCSVQSSAVNVVVRKQNTAGVLQLSYVYYQTTFPTIAAASNDLVRIVSEVLGISRLAIEVPTLFLSSNLYTGSVVIYQFGGLTGTQLALQFRNAFGCGTALPCQVSGSNPELLAVGWTYLVFSPTAGNGGDDGLPRPSFTEFNGLSTASDSRGGNSPSSDVETSSSTTFQLTLSKSTGFTTYVAPVASSPSSGDSTAATSGAVKQASLGLFLVFFCLLWIV